MPRYATVPEGRELIKILDSSGTKGYYALEVTINLLDSDLWLTSDREGFRVFNPRPIFEPGYEGDPTHLLFDKSWYEVVEVTPSTSPKTYKWERVQDGQTIDVIDNLNSDRTDAALSAKQGKLLKELATGLKIKVVSALPATGQTGVLYWVETASAGLYDQFSWDESTGTFEPGGQISLGLENYYTKDEINAIADESTLTYDTTTSRFKIKSLGVDTAQIKNGAVTAAKLNDMGATDGQILIYDTTNGWEAKDYEGAETDDITVKKNASDELEVNAGKGLVKGTTALDLDASTTFFDFAANKLTIKDSAIDTTQINDGAITKTKLNSAVVDNVTIGLDSTSGLKIKDGGIDTTQLKNGSVTKLKLNSNVVDNDTIGFNATDNDLEIKDSGVTSAKIKDGAVVKAKLGNDICDESTLTFNATDGIKVKKDGITDNEIADKAVTYAKLDNTDAVDGSVLVYKVDAIAGTEGWEPGTVSTSTNVDATATKGQSSVTITNAAFKTASANFRFKYSPTVNDDGEYKAIKLKRYRLDPATGEMILTFDEEFTVDTPIRVVVSD